ncbi:hypothetical protein U9M48_004460 [Paspalum notatum var. saurae]|uniref:Uncharacterized protein n=1 Tax=Paspalum notatum var. saurae TaxID=547442 RepID=A0AAQ3PTB8_PASNO
MSPRRPCPVIPSPPFARLRHLAITAFAPPPLPLRSLTSLYATPRGVSRQQHRQASAEVTPSPWRSGVPVRRGVQLRTGCLARGVSHVVAPVLRPLRLLPRCLSALSFVDRAASRGAPPRRSSCTPTACSVLGKAGGFVLIVESPTVRFNGAVDGEVLTTEVLIGPRRELYMTWQGYGCFILVSLRWHCSCHSPLVLTTQLQREASSYTAWQQVVVDASLKLLTASIQDHEFCVLSSPMRSKVGGMRKHQAKLPLQDAIAKSNEIDKAYTSDDINCSNGVNMKLQTLEKIVKK